MLKGIVLKRALPFVLAAFSGAFVFYMFAPIDVPAVKTTPTSGASSMNGGSGTARGCRGRSTAYVGDSSSGTFEPNTGTIPLKITSKPRATYTALARANNVEGFVRLKVTLLASGLVGGISVVRGLPDGLTDEAIAAARKLKFEPQKVDGRPISKTVTIDYTFDIY